MEPRRFLVTGGSQGIGAAIVRQARAAGHAVAFTGRDQGLMAAVAAETGAHAIQADVAHADDNARTVS
jgi:short-subunit dehydrogenase